MGSDLDIAAAATELAYRAQVVGNRSERMPGYVVDRVFDDQWGNTGFYAVGFVNYDAGRVVIGIRGSQDRLDVVSNGNLGIPQYQPNRDALLEFIGENILANEVVIAGHSLGGGLAQYLGYDAALAYSANRDKLVVHTHNGFGGRNGIEEMHGAFEPGTIAGARFRNYRHPGDLISRIGRHAGPVFNIPVADNAPNGVGYCHANRRFLPPESALDGSTEVTNEAFAIDEAMRELGPDLQKALKSILADNEPMEGMRHLAQVIAQVPAGDRAAVLKAALAFLPMQRVWERWAGRMFTRRRRH
jgi:hypothetical protein